MHIKPCYQHQQSKTESAIPVVKTAGRKEDEELEAIFMRTYGPIKQRTIRPMETRKEMNQQITFSKKPQCILVDGYNVIHAWDNLKELALQNLDSARMKLMDAMCNYQGYKNCLLILVFDAYQVHEGVGSMTSYHNIFVVYTRKAQTADMYIERATHKMAEEYQITVVTSDAMEQLIVIGQGAQRKSSRELLLELDQLGKKELKEYEQTQKKHRTYLLEGVRDLFEDEKK